MKNGNRLARRIKAMVWPIAIVTILAWSEWPTIQAMTERWMSNPQYSHGILVPLFAGYLLWHRRAVRPSPPTPAPGLSLSLIGAGVAAPGRSRRGSSYPESAEPHVIGRFRS